MMEDQKVFMVINNNTGECLDMIFGDDSMKKLAQATKEFIEKANDNDWVKYEVVELPLEGAIHKGKLNIITTIRMNNIPCRAIANSFYNLIEIIEDYMTREDEYKRYTYKAEFIKIN